jgi:hypothetical protein
MKKYFFYFLAFIIVSQLIRPRHNTSDKTSKNSIVNVIEVPSTIQNTLKSSCNDCHSNNTNYEWYHNIAPFSWVVAMHVKQGKEHLNFDEWANYNNDQKKHIIKDLKKTIKSREMPLVGYLKYHPEAVISDEENQELLDWITSLKIE